MAVSGGPDSLALVLLAHATRPGMVEAATIDHGLRPESGGEAAMVAQLCHSIGVPHTIARVTLARGNVQARAREARYAALGEWAERRGLAAVLTAHHADDQAETLLMRLNRGSGLAGLAGVRAAAPLGETLFVARPLLGWRKAELEAVCTTAGVEPARDPSNDNADFDRVRIRKALSQADWLDPLALTRSAGHLAEALDTIQLFADELWEDSVVEDGRGGYRFHPDAARVLNIEVIARILETLGANARRSEVARLHDRLVDGDNASLGGVLAQPGYEMVEEQGVEVPLWTFAPEPTRTVH